MPETYFVDLLDYGITLNVATIILVDWSEETIPEDLAREGFVATVQLVNRTNLYIGSSDAMTLQKALHDYNNASGRGDISRNRATLQQPIPMPDQPTTARQNNQKVAVAASGGNGNAARR